MSFASLEAFGAAPSTDLWTAPLDQLLYDPALQPQIPAARLYAVAVSELETPAVRDQMSLFGALSSDVLSAATRVAAAQVGAQGITPENLLYAGKDALLAIYNAMPTSSGSVMDSLSRIAGQTAGEVGAAIGKALPVIGAFIGFVTSVEDYYAQKAIADQATASRVCQQSYRPAVATRAAVYGGMTPADLMQSSMGDVFAAMESDTPERLAKSCASNSLIKKAIKAKGLVCGMYIPAATRRLLRILRLAIQNSWHDANSDAGTSLWPAYVDLVHAQFRLKHIDTAWITYLVNFEVLPANRFSFTLAKESTGNAIPEHQRSRMHLHKKEVVGMGATIRTNGINTEILPEFRQPLKPGSFSTQLSGGNWKVHSGGCLTPERRALDEFLGQLKEWELVINPYYQMDQAKADALRATIEQVIKSVSGTSPLRIAKYRKLPPGQRAVQSLRLSGKAGAMTMSPATSALLAVAAGGLVGGVGVWFMMRYSRRAA